MKVLLVHNEYGGYSGEEAVVDKMASTFQSKNIQVVQLRKSTAYIQNSLYGKIKAFFSGIYSIDGVKSMRNILREEKPDVVNIHNLYPFISPAALKECKKANVPVIMTVHNFRLICPTGLFMRDAKPCELCLQKGNELGCIRYNCEHSYIKSIGYALRNAFARVNEYYKKYVDYFACITNFQREKLIEAGFPKEKIIVIPNSIEVTEEYHYTEGNYVAYSGRISTEKGVDMIIEVAKRHPEIPFKLAGHIRDKELMDTIPDNVELMGYLRGSDLDDFNRNAKFFVMASKCYEGFPMSILEAAKFGKCVIAPNHGGFPEIIGTDIDSIGKLFIPGDVITLESSIVNLWKNPKLVEELSKKAYCKLVQNYSTEVIAKKWENLLNHN